MNTLYDGTLEEATFKETLARTIERLLRSDPDFVYLDSDLMNCIGTLSVQEKYPDRCINCGIAEADMIGIACGLASEGYKPLAHSFAGFASRRCFDQVFLSAGYARNAITVLGTDPGVCGEFNGGTHMPFEDIGLYRMIPGSTVIDVTDSAMLESVLEQVKDMDGVKYVRTGRKQAPAVFERGVKIPIGKAVELRKGEDAVVFAAGIMVHQAMAAADILEKEDGIRAAVVNLFTVKPLDEEAVCEYARRTGAVVTAENHNRIGGLYSAVSEALARCAPVPVGCVAVPDCFGEVGPMAYLQEKFRLRAFDIAEAVRGTIARRSVPKGRPERLNRIG